MTSQDAIRDMDFACLRFPVWSLVISKIFWESLASMLSKRGRRKARYLILVNLSTLPCPALLV
jgi:hypothetical protein